VSPDPHRRQAFQELHQSGCFVIANPWDIGSARRLAQLGFMALATTSSGFAWSLGQPDNHVTLEEALAHFRSMAASVALPVNGDFEGGFAIEPEQVGTNVRQVTATGVAGLSIEDSTGPAKSPTIAGISAALVPALALHALDEAIAGADPVSN
jgi:2-methylisocitrate lyase-like PEP mutase family enzyme